MDEPEKWTFGVRRWPGLLQHNPNSFEGQRVEQPARAVRLSFCNCLIVNDLSL